MQQLIGRRPGLFGNAFGREGHGFTRSFGAGIGAGAGLAGFAGQPFAIVRAVPTAALNRSRYMLLVFSDSRTPEQRAADAAQAQEAADRQAQSPIDGSMPAAPAPAVPVVPGITPVPAPAAAPAAPAAAPATSRERH